MSALPAAVRKQIEEANEIAKLIYPPQPEDPPAASDPPAAPPTGEAPPAAPPAAAPPPAPPAEPDSWEHKYKVLQGKYNAEVPRLTRQAQDASLAVQQLRDQLSGTQQLLASLNQNPPPPASGGTPPARLRLVKDEEIKEYGSDLIDLIGRAAREAVMPEVDERLRPVSSKLDQVSQVTSITAQETAKTAEQRVLDSLSEQVPNWLQLNEAPEFLGWLGQPDPYSGATRRDLLLQAWQNHDIPRVVAFFKGFLNENTIVTPPASPAAAPAAPQVDLNRMVAPGTQKTGAVGAQDGAGKRIWTRAEIAKFYDDAAKGKFARKQDVYKATEADIFVAQREGRIR